MTFQAACTAVSSAANSAWDYAASLESKKLQEAIVTVGGSSISIITTIALSSSPIFLGVAYATFGVLGYALAQAKAAKNPQDQQNGLSGLSPFVSSLIVSAASALTALYYLRENSIYGGWWWDLSCESSLNAFAGLSIMGGLFSVFFAGMALSNSLKASGAPQEQAQ